jgi:hypothetical protein
VLLQTVGICVEAFRTALLQLLLQQQTQKQETQEPQQVQAQREAPAPIKQLQHMQMQLLQQQKLLQCSAAEPNTKYDNITLMSQMAPISAAILLPMGIYEVGPTRVFSVLRENAAPVLANSVFALGMNLASLLVIQVSSSLTISLASIVRDWTLVCIAFVYFGANISSLSAVGWCITTAGLILYTALKNSTPSLSSSSSSSLLTTNEVTKKRQYVSFDDVDALQNETVRRSARHEDLA